MRILLALTLVISNTWHTLAQAPPDFTLYDQDSVAWNLYNELGKGNTVLLDFFFASCVPCQTYTPEIETIFQDYGSGTGDLVVLGISDRDNNAALAVFDSTYGVTYPTGGTQGNGNTITNLYMLWFPFFSWPNYAVVCADTSIFWGVTPSVGMAEIRNKIDTCDIVTWSKEPEGENLVLRIYPNPVEDFVHLDLSMSDYETVSIALYNIHGALLKKIKAGEGRTSWDMRELQSGYYLIEFANGTNIIHREKLMLIR